jgi:hypothetical protein
MKWHELENSKPAIGTLCLCRDGGGDDACYTIATYQDNSECPWLDYDDGETFWAASLGQYWIDMDEIDNEAEK